MMRWLLALLLLAGTPGDRTHFRYMRKVTAKSGGQTCAVIDPAIYAHASGSLGDLRLRRGSGEANVPYVLTLSGTSVTEDEPATVINLGRRGAAVEFDLQMPARSYTDVILNIDARNFLASAVVTRASAGVGKPLTLGTFTLFDLSDQRLSRSTTLYLQELNLPVLHVSLKPLARGLSLTPAMIQGASVPPSREGQTRYSEALTATSFAQGEHTTRARLTVPPRVPIERVRFTLDSSFVHNFSRDVRVASHAVGLPESSGEVLSGKIERVHLNRSGVAIDEEEFTIATTLGANLQGPAQVEIAILNGDDAPLPVQSVTLETRERELCFEASGAEEMSLFYGDAAIEPAQYDYARTFQADRSAKIATLGPETKNPRYTPRTDMRSITKRHPRLIYLGLILVICALAVVALRSARLRL